MTFPQFGTRAVGLSQTPRNSPLLEAPSEYKATGSPNSLCSLGMYARVQLLLLLTIHLVEAVRKGHRTH